MKKKPDLTTCDGMRKDGTCGNGYNSVMHNKKCPGHCKEWWNDAARNQAAATGKMPVAPVVAANGRDARSPSVNNYRDRVSNQYAAIETAKDNLLRECVKFGALLTEVSYFLGETQGRKGEGLQAWLAENCPEVNYSTAMGYKALATKCVKMLGGGSQAVAALQDKTEVIPPGEDAPIDVDAKFIEKRDELFTEVKSRRELEQTYFAFMASEGKRRPGRPKGSGGLLKGRRALTAEEKSNAAIVEAEEIVGRCVAFIEGGKFEMMTEPTQQTFVNSLKEVARSLEERMQER